MKLFYIEHWTLIPDVLVFSPREKGEKQKECSKNSLNFQKATKVKDFLALSVWIQRLNIFLRPRLKLNSCSIPSTWQSGSHTLRGYSF